MSFEYPGLFFLLLLIPLLLAGALLTDRKRRDRWRKLVTARLAPLLVRSGGRASRWAAFACGLAGLGLLTAALAAPNAGYEEETETIRGRNLLLAIDISRSMLAEDESPNRLGAALAAALEVIDQFPNDRIGLIAFSGSSFLQAPLTIDHAAVRESIQQLDPEMLRQLDADWLPRGGSDVSAAVRLAIDTFKETGQKNNALIIFSDGEHHEGGYESAGESAAEAGLTIFTAGFGTADGAFLPDPDQPDGRFRDSRNNLVFSHLDTDGLRTLARVTDGFYTKGSGRHFARNLETAVERLERFELEGRKQRVAIPRFQWFLFPAIILLVLSMIIDTPFHLAGRAAAVALALLCLPGELEARVLPATPAERALQDGEFEEALPLFEFEIERATGERRARLALGAGTAAYRLAQFDRATRSYSDALLSSDPAVQADAHFSLGNALFKEGDLQLQSADADARSAAVKATIKQWTDALLHYEDCLALEPDRQEASDNHAYVKKRLEELQQEQEEQEQQQQEQEQDPQEQDKEQEDGGEEEQENQPENQEEGDQEEPGEGENPDEEENEGDGPEGQPENNEGEPRDEPGEQSQPDESQDGGEEQETDQREMRPNETPEEHARRVLAENADFQMTPLLRQQPRQKRPEKDW